jgi:phosphonate ABC transporter permease subunit PhnE
MEKKQKSLLRSLGIGLGVIVVIFIYSYGFQVTDVNFETTRDETRLIQLTRVLRALVKPDIMEFEQEEIDVEVPFYLPCPEGKDVELPPVDVTEPYLVPSVPCSAPKESLTVEGFNLKPNSKGPINFVAASGVKLQLGNFVTDENGNFSVEVEIPTRQPIEEAQHIRATARTAVGTPKFTSTAKATLDKIIETVFIALLATTIGTFVAIPMSFIAARNLMADVKSPLTSVAFSLIGWPLGMWIGIILARQLVGLLSGLADNTWLLLIGVILGPVMAIAIARFGMSRNDAGKSRPAEGVIRLVTVALLAIVGVSVFVFLGNLGHNIGWAMIEPLGGFGFLGNFLLQLGDIASLLTPVLAALIGGAAIGGALGKFGLSISDNLASGTVKLINIVVSAVAGALLFALVGGVIDWFYQIEDLTKSLYWPAGIGAGIGVLIALIVNSKRALPTGMILYFITRTILNGMRSVEPLIMAIVFVIWVGIGPFAGSLALALHTVASLAKLYSEQVESIQSGPLEAVTATGANRIQTIVYAVVPQIIPPYISFTMYRWDINVRMSTIIGFVGGGGIGFLLIQNINLLDYRAASVQMVAIAIVVATMDYVSSAIRERFV